MDSFGKSKWNYKASNFFTGFHHIAYLESIKNSYGKPKTAKQNLPKLPYLSRRITPRYSSQYLEIKRRRSSNQTTNGNVKDRHESCDSYIKEDEKSIDPMNEDIKNCSQDDTFTEVLRELEMAQTKFQNEIINCGKESTAPKGQTSTETTDVASRLLESMKSIIVQEETNSVKDSSIIWDDSKSQSEVSEIMAKFPKETKTAMMVLLNRSKDKAAQKLIKKSDAKQVETQTSLRTSPTELYLPCVKNLLCTKGFHFGTCEGDSNFNINFVENII